MPGTDDWSDYVAPEQGHSKSELAELAARVHKAEPDASDVTKCVTCGGRIKQVPGGQGPTYVHADTGAVAAASPPKVTAYEVGKGRGDDHANYALAYGQEVSFEPTEIPVTYQPHSEEFILGWQDGVAAARSRDADLDKPIGEHHRLVIEVDARLIDSSWTAQELAENAVYFFQSAIDRAERENTARHGDPPWEIDTDDLTVWIRADYLADLVDAGWTEPPKEG